MPFTDDGTSWRDDRTRQANRLNDPYTKAGEKLAATIEHYLYDRAHIGFRNEDYLGWSLAQFDATKRGSGNHVNFLEWDPEDEPAVTAVPLSETRATGDRKDERLFLSHDEKVRRTQMDKPADPDPAADDMVAEGAPADPFTRLRGGD